MFIIKKANCLPGRHGFLNYNFSTRHGIFSYELVLVREAPAAPKITQAIAVALGCPLELDDKTLFLKIQHTWFQELEKSNWN